MSNFQPGPVQEANFQLRSGLKFACFRRDPSKYFVDIQKAFEALEIKKIENWTVTADPSGHLSLMIAYRDIKMPDPTAEMVADTISLVYDLTESVKDLSTIVGQLYQKYMPDVRPPVIAPSIDREPDVVAK